jgi:nucleoside-triphosphatase
VGRIWAVTGPPGIGKSTVVARVIIRLKSAGIIVGGCTTIEKKVKGVRVGFELRDLGSGAVGELASVAARMGPRVGKYRVNLVDLSNVGGAGLLAAASSAEAIVIDELGPMELVSPDFRRGVRACIKADRQLIAVVHERLDDDLVNEVKGKAAKVFTLTLENREAVEEELSNAVLFELGYKGSRGGAVN